MISSSGCAGDTAVEEETVLGEAFEEEGDLAGAVGG